MTAEGVLAFCLWFSGACAIVLGVAVDDPVGVLIGVLCIVAGEITAS